MNAHNLMIDMFYLDNIKSDNYHYNTATDMHKYTTLKCKQISLYEYKFKRAKYKNVQK